MTHVIRPFWQQLGTKTESEMTRGLGNSENTTSDNLSPQETTIQDAREVGADGAGFSCPGSSVVAEAKRS
jgi:hypothetical protein